jgi:hypothetical protein
VASVNKILQVILNRQVRQNLTDVLVDAGPPVAFLLGKQVSVYSNPHHEYPL